MIGTRTKFTALAVLFLCGGARAGEVPIHTPANETALPNIIYRVPYWTDMGDFGSYPTIATTVVITPVSGTCHFQVEWVGPNNTTLGYTGGPGMTYKSTTLIMTSASSGLPPLPVNNGSFFVPTVYSNFTNSGLFGYANVRTDCAANTKAMVAAFMTTFPDAPATGSGTGGVIPSTIVSIPVTKKAGDNGE